MPARIDKTQSAVGVVRGTLAADIAQASWNIPRGCGINSSGLVVLGAGTTGIVGVLQVDKTNYKAGTRCDIIVLGDFVDCVGFTAGTAMTANTTTGVISNAAASATQIAVGFTVEADRLVIRK